MQTSPSVRGYINRQTLWCAFGLSLYVTWSFVLWNSTTFLGFLPDRTCAFDFYISQGVATIVAALALVLSARAVAPLYKRAGLLFIFAAISAIAVITMPLGLFGSENLSIAFGAFALSGIGSSLRLGWEEWLSVQGVKRVAFCAGGAYAIGFVLYVIFLLLPVSAAEVVCFALPFGAVYMLSRSVCKPNDDIPLLFPAAEAFSLKVELKRIPWRLLVITALAFFSYGATRSGGVLGAANTDSLIGVVLTGTPMVASLAAIVGAYFFYKRNAALAFYLAFPLMALACIVSPEVDPFGGGTAFWVALVGAELIKYVVWFLLIESIIKDGISALLCVALLRVFQWLGSVLGQTVAFQLSSFETVSIAVLLALMIALLIANGVPPEFVRKDPQALLGAQSCSGYDGALSSQQNEDVRPVQEYSTSEKQQESQPLSTFERKVALLTGNYGLSPREQEVCSIWLRGHTAAYVERELFISKNTVKTHLNHIYAKTKTANREELLQLADRLAAENA